MLIDEFIALSLPFVLSIVIQLLQPGIRSYASRFANLSLPDSYSATPKIQKAMVDLAVYTYAHLSFVFSILLSSISCLTYTVLSPRPIFAAVCVLILVTLIPIWLIYWQGLSAQALEQQQGRWMKLSAWISIIALWAITLYARAAPMFSSL